MRRDCVAVLSSPRPLSRPAEPPGWLTSRSRGRIEIPPLDPTKRRESQLEIRGNPQREFARKSMSEPQFPANPIAGVPAISIVDQSLRNNSRTTDYKAIARRFYFSASRKSLTPTRLRALRNG